MSLFKKSVVAELEKAVEQQEKNNSTSFKPLVPNKFTVYQDESGNGSVLVRLLPAKMKVDEHGNDITSPLAYVTRHEHFFMANGVVYNSLCHNNGNDYGDDCPVCKFRVKNKIWEDGSPYKHLDEFGSRANMRSQSSIYYNVLVVKDPANPSNEGKVFQWNISKTIHKKVLSELKGDGLDPSVDVTCPFYGKNLKVRVMKDSKTKRNSYEASVFDSETSAIKFKTTDGRVCDIEDSEFQKYLFDNMTDLSELVDKETYQYDQEKAQSMLDRFLGTFSDNNTTTTGSGLKQAMESLADDGFDVEIDGMDDMDLIDSLDVNNEIDEDFDVAFDKAPPKAEEEKVTLKEPDDLDSILEGLDL